ncbi:MAG: hypothetical protein U1A27_10130 [Phycisphaerae bacterium]
MSGGRSQPSAGDLKSVYDYDYLGRRTRMRVYHCDAGSSDWATAAEVDRRFVYDGWSLETEMDGLDTDEDGNTAILSQARSSCITTIGLVLKISASTAAPARGVVSAASDRP